MDVVFQKDQNKQNPFLMKIKDFLKCFKGFKLPNSFYYFLILLVVGLGFYLYMLISNDFSLAYGGDYTAQYIPMGYHIWDYYHEWFETGHFTLFDSTLYLGVNSFGSNAYYGLFSPFNIIIVLLPRVIVPQSVAIASIIKLACAGLFFSIYMNRAFKVKEKVAYICGIAYAFAGWGAFYLWYNNYQDILVFLPLVLLGIEKTIQEEKPWVLSVGVFFLAICNYVLMVPYLVCTFFYAMFRFFQQAKKRVFKDNLSVLGFGILGFGGGLLMALFIVAPAFLATMSSPKLDTKSYGTMLKEYLAAKQYDKFFKLLFSWTVAPDQHSRIIPNRVYYPILEFFVPATTCRSLPSLEMSGWDFDDMAVSLWCYVPIIIFLVPALIQSGMEKKWSHYVGFALLTLTLFTPFMYYLTMGFSNGYARWTLFIPSSVIAYVGIYLDKIPNTPRWHIHLGALFAIAGVITAWILTWTLSNPGTKVDTEYVHRFIEYYNDKSFDYTNIVFVIELAYVIVVYLVLFFVYYKKAFHVLAMSFISIEAIAMGTFVTIGHGWDDRHNNGYAYNEAFRKVLNNVKDYDPSYYRVYTSIGDAVSTNNSFINNYRSVGFFHSLYNFEIDDFTLWTGLRNGSKSVSGDYRGKYQDVDNLLGVKYYFISKEKSKQNYIDYYYPGVFEANVPFDFDRNTDYENDNDFMVYENKNLPDFGVSYKNISYDSWWCSDLKERTILGYNDKKVFVTYDDCNPFGLIAGDFGNIDDIHRHNNLYGITTSVRNRLNGFSDAYEAFMNHFEIPASGNTYQPNIDDEAMTDYQNLYTQATSTFDYSYITFARKNQGNLTTSAIIGLNNPCLMTFNNDSSLKALDYQGIIANLFGFSSKVDFLKYAQNLVDAFIEYRINTTTEALANSSFLANNGNYILPFAIKNDLNRPVLMLVVIDSSNRVSIWLNDVIGALKAINYNKAYGVNQEINNELFCKGKLFMTGLDTLPSATNGVRYGIDSIKNAVILSTNAIIDREVSKEIKEQYNDFNFTNVKPSTDSIKELSLNVNYKKSYYDLRAFLDDYWQQHKRKYAYAAREYPFQQIATIPEDFTAMSEDDYNLNKSRAMDFFMFLTPVSDGEPLFKAGTAFYLKAPFYNDKKYDVYFMDKDNKIFMYDSHDDDTTDNTCYIRGFYIKKDVYRVGIVGKWGQSYLDSSSLSYYIENRADYETRKTAIFDHPIEKVKSEEDKFTFETHYDESRFVVSRVAYDKGWSIKAKNIDTGKTSTVKVYKGNGGFVSFVAPKGNYSYIMTYVTPYLTGSSVISMLAVTSFFVSLMGYHIYHEKKRNHYLDDFYREK